MDVWEQCQASKHISAIKLAAWRVVEAQHKSITRKLVDSLQEHELLEELIESIKPKLANDYAEQLDYLLYTPFRYPPLTHGSRFGRRFEPALWYGALDLKTALTELAYYRFVFLHHTDAQLDYVNCMLTAFSVNIKTNRGIDLTKTPFVKFRKDISDPLSYAASQTLGTEMRSAKIEAFLYYSARTENNEVNVGVFTPQVFYDKKPKPEFQTWRCIANKSVVECYREGAMSKQKYIFSVDEFSLNNHLGVASA